MTPQIIPEPTYTGWLKVRPHNGDQPAVSIDGLMLRPHEARWLADQLIDAANAATKQEVQS